METGGFLLQAIALTRIRNNRRGPGSFSCAKTSLSFTLRSGTGTESGSLLLATLFRGLLV
jgi:hypothetical protein